ncbi:SoxR reducing system RseC family protein [Eubacteriaceae bacterium ES3]|nr:SoxR reducing system RseC family protein [Eubacteriaceae bacterium ES3]
MTKYGKIVAVKNGSAILQVPRSTACGDKCASCSSHCNQGMIEIEVKNNLDAQIGDHVEVESATHMVLGAAFLVYLVPLVMMLLGIFLTNIISNSLGISPNEFLSAFVGFCFLALTFVAIRFNDNRRRKKKEEIFTMKRLIKH